jgi:hypothetical protein
VRDEVRGELATGGSSRSEPMSVGDVSVIHRSLGDYWVRWRVGRKEFREEAVYKRLSRTLRLQESGGRGKNGRCVSKKYTVSCQAAKQASITVR